MTGIHRAVTTIVQFKILPTRILEYDSLISPCLATAELKVYPMQSSVVVHRDIFTAFFYGRNGSKW